MLHLCLFIYLFFHYNAAQDERKIDSRMRLPASAHSVEMIAWEDMIAWEGGGDRPERMRRRLVLINSLLSALI